LAMNKPDLHKFAPASELGPAENYPAGSVEWAERISNRLQIGAKSITTHTVHHLWDTIKAILTAEPQPWEIWPEGTPFGTPDDYCLAVTGHSWEFLIGMVAEFADDNGVTTEMMRAELAKAQAEHRKQGAHQPADGRKSLGDQGSNNRERLLRRLARDHPDILKRYERGEFKSVRAAAIAAGIIKPPTLFERFEKLVAKMSDAERRRAHRHLDQLCGFYEGTNYKPDPDQSSMFS
jgi:hypothetical protein